MAIQQTYYPPDPWDNAQTWADRIVHLDPEKDREVYKRALIDLKTLIDRDLKKRKKRSWVDQGQWTLYDPPSGFSQIDKWARYLSELDPKEHWSEYRQTLKDFKEAIDWELEFGQR